MPKWLFWVIEKRIIPLPAGSKLLRKSISKLTQPDVDIMKKIVPKTSDQWKKFAISQAKKRLPVIEKLLKKSKIKVEKSFIANIPVFKLTSEKVSSFYKNCIFIYLHGGGYVLFSGKSGLQEPVLIAERIKVPVISIDYRMPPDYPFPAAINDVVAVYKEILKKKSFKSIIIGGTSAGGGLALAVVLKLKKLGIKLPDAIYAGTPWTDLTKTGDSYFINEGIDHVLITYNGLLEAAAKLYAGKYSLKNPLISPVYGDFHGFPPTFFVSGTRDLFLSNVVRAYIKMKISGVKAELNVFEGFSHADYLFFFNTEESKEVYKLLDDFLKRHL